MTHNVEYNDDGKFYSLSNITEIKQRHDLLECSLSNSQSCSVVVIKPQQSLSVLCNNCFKIIILYFIERALKAISNNSKLQLKIQDI
jgi:hypothetical protein